MAIFNNYASHNGVGYMPAGLEFEDVIIINPFSDMAQHGPPGLKSLWGYVLPEQRSTFNDSTHALLCSWLKCLHLECRHVWWLKHH